MIEFKTIGEYQDSIKKFKLEAIKGFESLILSSTNDRAKLQLRLTPYTDKKCGYGCHDLDFGLYVYQSRQAEIDELRKRIDKVIHMLTYTNHASTTLCNKLICTLKGTTNEQ